jgi:vitamin B12/bleomycin/antimicrobial peptide transport system ATP-binding/permease protein
MRGLRPFLRDAWLLGKPYFTSSEERWAARGLLLAIIVLNLSTVGLSVLFNFWRADFYNALQAKDWDSFIDLLLLWHRTDSGLSIGFSVLAFTHIAVAIYEIYMSQWLQIRWRRWLTSRYLNEWLADRAYYRISLTTDRAAIGTDNPDQRIAEDLRDFADYTLTLSLGLLRRVVTLLSFLTILWGLSGSIDLWGITIPGYLFWLAVVYATAGTVLAHYVGRPLAALNFRQQRVEADFRYSLVRLRENMEGIALYGGEDEEKGTLLHRFGAVVGNWRAIMKRTKLLNMAVVGQGQAAAIFPYIIIAPRYFAGKVQLGQMFQTVEAFSQVLDSLSWIVNAYTNLANWRAIVERLATFHRAIVAARAAAGEGLVVVPAPDNNVSLEDVTLALPNGAALLRHAGLNLDHGRSVVVTGRSGSGKSTLFRTLAGIWPFGEGRVRRPIEGCLFLPQRPYIPLGSLRHVVTYPYPPNAHSREEITRALEDAGLAQFVPRLDRDENWAQSMSGGEQQRVALARALLAKPDWLFLDEATASLDPAAEAELYRTLRARLPNTTLVSIAHRPSVAAFHERRLVLQRDEGKVGELVPTELAPAVGNG